MPTQAEMLAEQTAGMDLSYIDELRAKYDEFVALVRWLQNTDMRQFPALEARRQKLLGGIGRLQAMVDAVTSGLGSLWGWGQAVFGLNGMRRVAGQMRTVGLDGWPAVAAVAAVVAALGYFATEVYSLGREYDAANSDRGRIEGIARQIQAEQGIPYADAYRAAERAYGSSSLSTGAESWAREVMRGAGDALKSNPYILIPVIFGIGLLIFRR